jgi:transposase
MIIAPRCVGIDVSKAMLDIFDDAIGTPERIANAPQPIAQQVARWRNNDVFVVFEATGVYDRALADALRQAGIRYARVNPARARDFARASGRLAKTDAIDARMLAAFAQAMAPAAEPPPEPARNILASLAKRRDQLVHMRAQEKNRRSEVPDPAMAEHIAVHIDFLSHEIKAIEAKIKAFIKAEPKISEQARLLRSAPGIGPVACMQLIAQMPELGRTGPKQVAALAGLAPSTSIVVHTAASGLSAAAVSASAMPFIWLPSMPYVATPTLKAFIKGYELPENRPSSPSSPSLESFSPCSTPCFATARHMPSRPPHNSCRPSPGRR